MKSNIKMNKSALSKMLAIAIIVIVVIVVVAGAYYYSTTLNPSTNPSPSPSATPSSSPSQTTNPSSTASPTAAPSASQSPTTSPTALPSPSTQTIANFRAGAYANYTIKTYDKTTGNETSSIPMNWQITDGATVWVVTESTTITADNVTTNSYIIMNIDKTTYKPVSGELKVISEGVTILDQSIDLSSPQYNATSQAIDPTKFVGQESITVAAGTFNAQKATTTDPTTGAVNNVWVSSNIPVWGIVKMTTTEGTVVTSITELIAYG